MNYFQKTPIPLYTHSYRDLKSHIITSKKDLLSVIKGKKANNQTALVVSGEWFEKIPALFKNQ